MRVVWAGKAHTVVMAMHAHRPYVRLASEPITVATVCVFVVRGFIVVSI